MSNTLTYSELSTYLNIACNNKHDFSIEESQNVKTLRKLNLITNYNNGATDLPTPLGHVYGMKIIDKCFELGIRTDQEELCYLLNTHLGKLNHSNNCSNRVKDTRGILHKEGLMCDGHVTSSGRILIAAAIKVKVTENRNTTESTVVSANEVDLQDTKSVVEHINQLIKEKQNELQKIQDNCMHLNKTKMYKSNTDNYDPTRDRYWVEYHCLDCGKRWNEVSER